MDPRRSLGQEAVRRGRATAARTAASVAAAGTGAIAFIAERHGGTDRDTVSAADIKPGSGYAECPRAIGTGRVRRSLRSILSDSRQGAFRSEERRVGKECSIRT